MEALETALTRPAFLEASITQNEQAIAYWTYRLNRSMIQNPEDLRAVWHDIDRHQAMVAYYRGLLDAVNLERARGQLEAAGLAQ